MNQAPRIRINLVAGRKEDRQALTPEQAEKFVSEAVDKFLKGLAEIDKNFSQERLDTSK